jgi:hypothetical protein
MIVRVLAVCATLSGLFSLLALGSARDEDSALHGFMKGLKDQLKPAAAAVKAEDAAAALPPIAEMQRLVLLAKLEPPANLAEVAAGEQEAHATAFRRELATLLGELAQLEIEVLDGRFDEAMARIQGPLFQLREAGHDKFKKAKRKAKEQDG